MKKKDQEAIAQLYTEAGAFYSGGSRTPNDPLGLGSIRMAEPGENPFSDDDDDYSDSSSDLEELHSELKYVRDQQYELNLQYKTLGSHLDQLRKYESDILQQINQLDPNFYEG